MFCKVNLRKWRPRSISCGSRATSLVVVVFLVHPILELLTYVVILGRVSFHLLENTPGWTLESC